MYNYISLIVSIFQSFNLVSVIFRIFLASLCGALLGIERSRSNQSAGLRTHMLVCLGAAIVMLTSQHMLETFGTGDPARLGAQVISGIGFLGAGSIIMEGKMRVRGLTTAAGLWASACIGLALGIGFYSGGIIATAAVYLITSKLKPVAHHLVPEENEYVLYVELDNAEMFPDMFQRIQQTGARIEKTETNHQRPDGSLTILLSVRVPHASQIGEVLAVLGKQSYVKEAKHFSLD